MNLSGTYTCHRRKLWVHFGQNELVDRHDLPHLAVPVALHHDRDYDGQHNSHELEYDAQIHAPVTLENRGSELAKLGIRGRIVLVSRS